MRRSFIGDIVNAYLDEEPLDRLVDTCFVFPNKRACTFFHQAMSEAMQARGLRGFHPESCTIVDLVTRSVDTVHADRLESIFILYGVYRRIQLEHYEASDKNTVQAPDVDFNSFQRWADVLMSDINEVDMQLVDPAELFHNIEAVREISSNYLTENQAEAILRHWGDPRLPGEVSEFWNHVVHPNGDGRRGSKASAGFIKLWQVLFEVYTRFRETLREKGLHYMGMAYREICETLPDREASDLPCRRYVFVGFNMLSRAEQRIFAILRDKPTPDGEPLADFYWDTASPAFADEGNPAVRFLREYFREFPSLHDCPGESPTFPRIHIVGVPSRIGQAKYIGDTIAGLFPGVATGAAPDPERMLNTAVVLPDENMALPVLRAIPADIKPVNLTMGYRLRNSSVGSLVSDVVGMQLRARRSRSGEPVFFHKDVIKVLSHPFVRLAAGVATGEATMHINLGRVYNVTREFFTRTDRYSRLLPLFDFIDDRNDTTAVLDYLTSILRWVLDAMPDATLALRAMSDPDQTTEETDPETTVGDDEVEPLPDGPGTPDGPDAPAAPARPSPLVIDTALVLKYLDAIDHLRRLTATYLAPKGAYMADTTVFHLVERLVAGETVSFEGRPLEGLQIMGVLEARVIDFGNLFIPSMNEQIFPRRHFPKTFIPNVLRQAYGMLTTEHQEASYAYYFYRMLTRARHVWLTYDARQGATSGGDMSRFIHQLLRIYRPEGMTHEILGYDIRAVDPDEVVIYKTPQIMRAIERYRTPGSGKALSASSIRSYIECPLKFYLEYICHIKRQDEIRDWMDEGVFGSVVHRVLENIYTLISANPRHLVTPQALRDMAANGIVLDREVTRAINELYLKLPPDKRDTPLQGADIINARLVRTMVESALVADTTSGEFDYIHGEYQLPAGTVLTLTGSKPDAGEPESVTFNFGGTIDRIDCLRPDTGASQLRIIDYKTGAEASDIKLEDLVPDISRESVKFSHAIVQLFFYAQALEKTRGFSQYGGIQPMVYPLRTAAQKSFAPVKIDGDVITDHRTVVNRINDRVIPFIKELFDPDAPLRPSVDGTACTYCKFTEICGSKTKK